MCAGQLKNGNRIFEGCHKDILNEKWNFVRAIAIPNINKKDLDDDICCQHCLTFIMGSEDIQNCSIWIKNLLTLFTKGSHGVTHVSEYCQPSAANAHQNTKRRRLKKYDNVLQ
jgi:hypothetical protein